MSGLGWVRIASWHLIRTYTRTGAILTRCGRLVGPDHEIVDALPFDGRSCESCLRLAVHDEDIRATENDVVPDPGPEDATVPG
jgi:hypothetical protein